WKYFSWFYNSCRHVYVPSQSMIDELKSHNFTTDLRIWERGVNTQLFAPDKRDENWRLQVGFKPDEIVVTFVSRLVWEKELATFVHCIKTLKKKKYKIRALIVGEGPAKEELKQQLPEAVYTGFLENENLAR